MTAGTYAARDLEEGCEVLLRAATGEVAIVENVETNGARTVVTLTDGRSRAVAFDAPVTVLS